MYLIDLDCSHRSSPHGTFHLYAIGDLHRDRRDFQTERFNAYIDHIKRDKQAVAVFVGDALDGRIPGRKHFDIDECRPEFRDNLRNYVGFGLDVVAKGFIPLIRAKVPLVLVSGNHDEYLEEINFTAALAQRLGAGAHYLGGEGFIRIKTGRMNASADMRVTSVYATHGSGGGKTPGPKVNAMQRYYEWVDADVVMAGHVHDGDIRIIPSYGIQRKGALELQRRPRIMYRAPAFVYRAIPGVVGYQGKKGYGPGDEGLQYVAINPCEHRAHRLEVPI